LLPRLNERDRCLVLATEAKSWGRGGITAVHDATGVSRKTIQRGMVELSDDSTEGRSDRVRTPGGGRKKAEIANPELADALESLIESDTRGDPESPLAVDHEINAPPRCRADRDGSFHESQRCREAPPFLGLQPARNPQEDGGTPAPGPRRSVPIHQQAGS
jgi:hypothetical protein